MSERKPKVLFAILTGIERQNWVNPDLTVNLLRMARDPRFDVEYLPLRDARPWESARNVTIHAARSTGADWLLSIDNDNFVQGNPLDIIATAGDKRVIGLTYGSGADSAQYRLFPYQNHGANDGAFRQEECVGGGVLMVHKTVWQTLPRGPWFRWQHSDSELLAPDANSAGEDVFFCRLVQQHGIKVWSHQQLAGHYRTVDITKMISPRLMN